MTRQGWRVTRLKYVSNVNQDVLPEDTDADFEFRYVDIGNVAQGSVNVDTDPIKFRDAPSRARRVAQPGDSVVSTVRTYLRAVAAVPSCEDPLVFSTGFAVFHPNASAVPQFLSWYLQGDEFVSRVEASSVGVSYPATTSSNLSAMAISLPPADEQRAIADYLDRETQQIDELIDEQRGLIELLKERRVAVITRYVTLGADSSTGLVRADSPWLDSVPEGWHISRFRFVATIDGEMIDPRLGEFPGDVLIAPNHVESGTGRLLSMQTAEDQSADSSKYRVSRGQIVFSKIRPSLNKVIISPVDGLCSADMYPITFDDRVDTRYALYQMLARPAHDYVTERSARVKMPKVNREELADLPWVLPPLEEQRAISDHLDAETSKIDTLIAECEGFIALSQERRAALITAAVTGQIDVREMV